MTEKQIVECDGPDTESCLGTQPAYEGVPPEWSTFETDDTELHFCPPCTSRARGLLTGGRSVGPKLKVSHNYLGREFEQANIHAGTHGLSVSPVIDEPPRRFPDYDHDDEAWHIGVFDHLHVYVFGSHKGEPLVVVDSDEWPTQVTVTDLEDSFEEPDPGFKIRSLEELQEARDE